jgi:LysM repeat protein
MASVPRLQGKLRARRIESAQREWATLHQHYAVRVGRRLAHVSDNIIDLLRLIDGSRTVAELATELGMCQNRYVHPAEVLYLLRRRLAPAGLVSLKASARSMAPAAAPTRPAISSPVPTAPAAAIATPSVEVTQPLPELAEASPISSVLPAAYVALPLADAARIPMVDDTPTLPTVLWREASAPVTPAIPPLATLPAPAPDAAQRAPVPASVARPPVVSPPRGVPARTRIPPPMRRPWTVTAGRTALGIVGLAFLLGALVATLSLDGQRPSFFAQPDATRPTPVPTSTPLHERIVPGERAYAVKPGDTLADIAGRYGLSAGALLIVNGDILPQASSLRPGMQLAIPAVYNPALTPTAQPRPLYYMVRPGDTLYDIGAYFGTNWNAIADYNHLADPRTLEVGQGLLIPPSGP